MAYSTMRYGDLSTHLLITKSIYIKNVTHASKKPRKLEILLNNLSIPTTSDNLKGENTADDSTSSWTLKCDFPMFPSFDPEDTLTLRTLSDSFDITYTSIFNKFKKHDENAQKSKDGGRTKEIKCRVTRQELIVEVTLQVVAGSIADSLTTERNEELDSKFLKRAVKFIDSISSNMENAKKLKGVLENLPDAGEALQALEGVVNTVAGAHPLAKAVLTALSIPYKLMKNEQKFNDKIKDLTEVMLTTCECLMDAQYHAKITSMKSRFLSIMRTVRDASLYVKIYVGKGRVKKFIDAQFSSKLDDFSEDLITKKNDFQMAVIVQIAHGIYNLESMTAEAFLEKRLDPAKLQRLEGGCLVGTRVNILEEVRKWLENPQTDNILWIFGPPGAGKSTIATTLAKELVNKALSCVKVFCKRDEKRLRDPRQVWQTLAYGLADKHAGLKAAIMRTLEKNRGDPQDYTVVEQFEMLIKGPLETDMEETSFRVDPLPYPVIIIDALDELHVERKNNEDWESFLETLGSWSSLSGKVKLIVTSRNLSDICSTLGDACVPVDLTTKANMEDSKNDVEKLFKEQFKKMHKDFDTAKWPIETAIPEMVNYAAGLFIWARMVVNFVKGKGAGVTPSDRLAAVHREMSYVRTPDGNDVDRLYARILLEAFLSSDGDERKRGKTCLAAIVLAKEPVGMNDIVELFSAEQSNANAYVGSTLEALSPIISTDADGKLRVTHKTVSDFLLSRDRSEAAMKIVVRHWNTQMPEKQVDPETELETFILDCAEENGHLALAYLRLVLQGKIPKRSLNLARGYWKSSRTDTGDTALKILVNAIDFAFGRLHRFERQFVFTNDVAQALIENLLKAIEFFIKNDQDDKNFQRELEQQAKDLDGVRGDFQIQMIENLLSEESSNQDNKDVIVDQFLRERLEPSDQRELDEPCLRGTRIDILEKARSWWNSNNRDPKFNLLWIYGAPGAGKSAIAATLIKELEASKTHVHAKVVAKRDIVSRRDPGRIWQTLAYGLACSRHTGVKGSMMEALFVDKDSHPLAGDPRRVYELIVKALQEQQCLSIVFIIDALDECLDEDSVEWGEFLQSLVGWTKQPHWHSFNFKLVVTSRDIPSIRGALGKVSKPIFLATGSDISAETRSDIGKFLRDRLPDEVDAVVVKRLTEKAAGSFIWAKMIVDLLKIVGNVDRLEDILEGNKHSEDIDTIYANILLETSHKLDKEWEAARTILATIVLAKDSLTKIDIAQLIAQTDLEGPHKLVDKAVKELSSIIFVDNDQTVRIPHKSFCDFLIDHNRSQKAMTRALEQSWKRTDNSAVDSRSIIIDRADESRRLAFACSCLIRDGVAQGRVADLFKRESGVFNYARRFFVEHLEGAPSLLQLGSLATTMEIVFKCLERYSEDGGFEREEVTLLAGSLRVAAQFVILCIKDTRFLLQEQIGYAEDLIKKKNNFQIAAIVKTIREHWGNLSMTSDDFYRGRLEPVKGQPLEELEVCLEGTRVDILTQARKWLQDPKAEKNILWIRGPPGAGKSTIATTLAKELAEQSPFCVNFFCNRGVRHLRDPRWIWSTLACSLADKHAGMKAAIMRTLDENGGDARFYSVIAQFEEFIKRPLETDMKETSFCADSLKYPVIIIDALDECYLAKKKNRDWKFLLESLGKFSEMSGKIKLIVTSRNHPDIHKSIEPVSHSIDLSTRTEDSNTDIMMLFTTKFSEIREEFDISDLWPSEEELTELMEYAAGLIGWADSVIKFVRAGADPRNYLKQVLNGIAAGDGASSLGDHNRVYLSYARILLEGFRLCLDNELNKAKRCLAAVVLAKKPLTRDEVVTLLSTDSYDASNVVDIILLMFSPIMTTSDGVGALGVFHKTVSDFLLSRKDSEAAMKFVVERWNEQRPNMHISDPHSFILDCEEESKHLSLDCLRLIHRTLAKDISSIAELFKQSRSAFFYARRYWFAHFRDAGLRMHLEQCLERLAGAMDSAFACLDRFVQHSDLTNNEAEVVIRCLGDAAYAAYRYVKNEQTAEDVNAVRQELAERTMALDSAKSKLEIALRGCQQE